MRNREGERDREIFTSALPLPNPWITGPDSLNGNGASGPLSGPA